MPERSARWGFWPSMVSFFAVLAWGVFDHLVAE